ncbi:MAG TPA: hypothetical protein VMB84_11265 [Stellaceae bacterium]|nr:hypothetical protein [Stellaceae bacterium]
MSGAAAAPSASDLIVVSAADSGYFPLLSDMVLSVRARDRDVPLGVLDLGLAPAELGWLEECGCRIVRPGWDIDFPRQARMPETFKAQVARPFLPRHFPGFATYLWLDADAWLQDWRAVELYCAAAAEGRLAISVEIDRAYKRHYKRPKLFGRTLPWRCYREAFGWRVANRLGRNPFANCGVFALQGDAPHWEVWARLTARVLQRTQFFFAEQIALNYAIFGEGLPADLLPAYCNWAVGDAAPVFDRARGLFVEPYTPHEVIGVVHLAGREQKNKLFRLACLDGGTIETSLRYAESRAVCAPAAARVA